MYKVLTGPCSTSEPYHYPLKALGPGITFTASLQQDSYVCQQHSLSYTHM
jgi:hypothetical protein